MTNGISAVVSVPDVGALVEYGLNSFGTAPARYRVSGWVRVAPEPEIDPDDVISQILHETCREFDTMDGRGKKRLQFCLREEATHLSLSGIAGAIAPVELCVVVGKVAWAPALLEEARQSAIRRGTQHRMIV